jgi:hypothetical protein
VEKIKTRTGRESYEIKNKARGKRGNVTGKA